VKEVVHNKYIWVPSNIKLISHMTWNKQRENLRGRSQQQCCHDEAWLCDIFCQRLWLCSKYSWLIISYHNAKLGFEFQNVKNFFTLNGGCLPIDNRWYRKVIPYILKSNLHPFYSFRGLKNQMRIRIECGLDSRSRAGFWKNYRAGVRAVRTIQLFIILS
jgi:hypothetical protein